MRERFFFTLTGVAACICTLLLITQAFAANVIISGDYTDVGTIVVVSPKPNDSPTANGAALLNTLNNIPSDLFQPYLIKLGPGTYNLGSNSLVMKQFVSIEGSGEEATAITAAVSSPAATESATVKGANNSGLRFLTVVNTGTGSYTVAIVNSSASPSMLHVTAAASGGTTSNFGVFNYLSSPTMTNVTASGGGGTNSSIGVYNSSSSPTMTNVTASGGGGTNSSIGVYNSSSSPMMTNVTASGSGGTNNYGVSNDASSPTMTNVTVDGSGGTASYGVYNSGSGLVKINHSRIRGAITISNGSGVNTRVGNTQLDGGAATNSGTIACVGLYDQNYAKITAIGATACQ